MCFLLLAAVTNTGCFQVTNLALVFPGTWFLLCAKAVKTYGLEGVIRDFLLLYTVAVYAAHTLTRAGVAWPVETCLPSLTVP